MLSTLQILQGWTNKLLDDYNLLDPDIKMLSDMRMKECGKCPFNNSLSGGSPAKCLKCGCNLPQKTMVVIQKCPIDKW